LTIDRHGAVKHESAVVSVVIYLAAPADLTAAQLPVAGRPVVFRAVAVAVRAGASRVFVPALFRDLLSPALASAPRVARAVEWLGGATPAPGDAVLVPATAVIGVGAVAAMRAARPPAAHQGARDVRAPIVTAPAPLVASLWSALAAGAPIGPALDEALADPTMTLVREPSLVHLIRDPASAAIGERRLYTTLGSAIDTRLDTVFHRRFSRLVSRLAVGFGITPNTITVASLLVGLAAASAFWRATPIDAVVGLILYAIAVILDHADGEVARLTLTESALGEWLDIAVDTIIHVAVVLALGVTSAAVTGHGAGLGMLAALGVIASSAVAKAWPGLAMPDRVGTALSGLGSRDGFYAMLLAFILARAAWPAALPWLMVVVAGGSHAYWVGRLLYRLIRGA
jgi:phosphatidylglycerophosphate synthase